MQTNQQKHEGRGWTPESLEMALQEAEVKNAARKLATSKTPFLPIDNQPFSKTKAKRGSI